MWPHPGLLPTYKHPCWITNKAKRLVGCYEAVLSLKRRFAVGITAKGMLSTYPASVVIRSYSPWFVPILTGVTKVRNPREEDSASYPWFV
jgi:hypothetical protein